MSQETVRRAVAVTVMLAVVVLFVPGRAAAQARQVEFSAGWSYANESDESMPAGWYASAGRYVNNWFGIVGEVSGHYKTVEESGVDIDRDFHLFAAGPRFAYRRYPRFTPFVDLLVGGRRGRAVIESGADTDEPVTNFDYQSLFGLSINNSTGAFGLRVAVGDYGVRAHGEWSNDALFEAGVVFRR